MMSLSEKDNIRLCSWKEVPMFLAMSLAGYLLSLLVVYMTTSRNLTVAIAVIILLLYTVAPKRTLFFIFNIIFFSGLAGTSFEGQAVWFINKITLPSSGGKSMIAVKYELLPLVVYGILFIQLFLNKKILDRQIRILWRLLGMFILISITSSLILGTSKYELFHFIVKFTGLFAILILVTTLDLSSRDLRFMFTYIIFCITVVEIGLILVGWGLPTVQGTYINPDNWGGTEGTKSINFLNLVSIAILFFIYRIYILKSTKMSDWIYLISLVVLLIVPFSTVLLITFAMTLFIILLVQSRRKITMVLWGMVFPLVIYLSYSILISNFYVFSMFGQVTSDKISMSMKPGFFKNPKIQAVVELAEMYVENPETIVFGKGPGMYISGASAQLNYLGPLEDITGGAQTKNIPLIVTFAESGIIGGIIIYSMLGLLLRLFYTGNKNHHQSISIYGFYIVVLIIVVSLFQESFEYPSVALVEGCLLGIIYRLTSIQDPVNGTHL